MKRIFLAAAIGLASVGAYATEMGISAKEAYAKIQQQDKNVLLVDVRDPVEIMFVGFADAVDVNIPFMTVDRTRFNEERGVFALDKNEAFADMIKAELAKRGMDESAEVITMCRSGSERGEPSAVVLRDAGLPNARFVVNGFQGDPLKEGEQAGMRLQNGWQNSGLPWSRSMNPDKVYRLDRQASAE